MPLEWIRTARYEWTNRRKNKWKIKSIIREPQDCFTVCSLILSHCSVIPASRQTLDLALWLKGYVFSFVQLSPSNKYFFLNTQILIIFPFWKHFSQLPEHWALHSAEISGFCCQSSDDCMNCFYSFISLFPM